MKIIEVSEFGDPLRVARCVDAPEPAAPGPDEVLVQTLAFPIHPADVMLIRGSYLRLPPLPFVPGIESSGRILQVGSGVPGLKAGDLVLSLKRQTWAERRTVKAEEVVALGDKIDPLQLSMLYLNPLTAWCMLSRPEITDAKGEDKWIVQNAGNSSVGLWVNRLAPRFRVKVVNVVRRPDALVHVEAPHGAVIVDGASLASRVGEIAGDGRVVAALDAISGRATGRLAECVMPGGTVLVYGNMAEEPSSVPTEEYLFRGVSVTGFSVTRTTTGATKENLVKPLEAFARETAQGFRQVIESTYPMKDIASALAHATRERRRGKILVTVGDNG
jgi:trans-2-enoyl-CoA reductase